MLLKFAHYPSTIYALSKCLVLLEALQQVVPVITFCIDYLLALLRLVEVLTTSYHRTQRELDQSSPACDTCGVTMIPIPPTVTVSSTAVRGISAVAKAGLSVLRMLYVRPSLSPKRS